MFKHHRYSRNFILGKTEKGIQSGEAKLRYRKRVEKAVIYSILLVIFLFRLTMNVDIQNYLNFEDRPTLQSIDLKDIPIMEEPPIQTEEIVELEVEEPEPVPEIEPEDPRTVYIEEQPDLKLALASNDNSSYLFSDSQMEGLPGNDLNLRANLSYDVDNVTFGSRKSDLDVSNTGIDIGKRSGTDRYATESPRIDLKIDKKKPPERPQAQKSAKADLRIVGKGERIISLASSTIGTEDYKLWNKINAELDRLNKGTYGHVPDEIERTRAGFIINFDYADASGHQINWQNDGNVWIKIKGDTNRSTIFELRRALNALLSLGLAN